MFRNLWIAAGRWRLWRRPLPAQERRSRIDVEHYVINAEINENTQTLAAKVAVRFMPLDDNINFRHIRVEQCAERLARD